jgi:hypothetical protein
MEGQERHAFFIMEAMYGCSLVSSHNSSEAYVFEYLEFFPNPFLKE